MDPGDETVRSDGEEVADGWLVRAVGLGQTGRLQLLPEQIARVGRAPGLALTIAHESVSRVHCEFRLHEMGLDVVDLSSSNGTYVDGRRLVPGAAARVGSGAAVRLGEVVLLVTAPRRAPSFTESIGRGEAMSKVLALLDRVADDDITVLLLGETGVGKEVLSYRIHQASRRAAAPLVKIHCAALPETLIEAELFGHEKGAFTGAASAKPGLFQVADGGTVLIDEVGEIPLGFQVKLLRVLEERKVTRIGARAAEPIDVRFIAATHRDLRSEVKRGRFREDLYYRLNGVSVRVPPLRERKDELPALVDALLETISRERRREKPVLSGAALAALRAHEWPGNIRELRNVLARACLLADRSVIDEASISIDDGSDLPGPSGAAEVAERVRAVSSGAPSSAGETLQEERRGILEALERSGGNQKEAAKLLGIARRTLLNKLDVHQLTRPRKKITKGGP